MTMDRLPELDQLTTPVVWADAHGHIEGSNTAFARWLGVSPRRLPGQPLAALEHGGELLRRAISGSGGDDPLRLRRVSLA